MSFRVAAHTTSQGDVAEHLEESTIYSPLLHKHELTVTQDWQQKEEHHPPHPESSLGTSAMISCGTIRIWTRLFAPVCFCEPFSANHFHIWDTISRCKGHCPGDILSNNNASDAPLVLLITHMNGLTWWNNLRNEQRYTMRKKKNVNSFELRFCQLWFMNALPEFSFASLLSSFWHKLYTRCIYLFVC